jgi:hypothetical protein
MITISLSHEGESVNTIVFVLIVVFIFKTEIDFTSSIFLKSRGGWRIAPTVTTAVVRGITSLLGVCVTTFPVTRFGTLGTLRQ